VDGNQFVNKARWNDNTDDDRESAGYRRSIYRSTLYTSIYVLKKADKTWVVHHEFLDDEYQINEKTNRSLFAYVL